MSSGEKSERRAQVGLAAAFVVLAFVLQFFLGAPFLWYGGIVAARSGWVGICCWYAVPQAVLLGGVMFCLLEGVRGIRQRATGAVAVVILSIAWILIFGLIYERVVGGA